MLSAITNLRNFFLYCLEAFSIDYEDKKGGKMGKLLAYHWNMVEKSRLIIKKK